MKGVIVAAGYGSRFLPVTKTVPKEMLPLINVPSIDFIVEEFLRSGIEEILVISSRRKRVLEDYLDREIELESVFAAAGARAKLEKIAPPRARFFFVRQQEMLGTGHALLLTRPFVGGEPFVVAYPDDLHFGEVPLARQLIESYERTGCSVLATLHDPPDIQRYGTIGIAPDGLHVTDLVEKAPPGTEPSREASIGRFLYTPEIFERLEAGWRRHLEEARRAAGGPGKPGARQAGLPNAGPGEYFHTAAVKSLAVEGKVVFRRVEGKRLDIGEPEGFLVSLLAYVQGVPSLRAAMEGYLKEAGWIPPKRRAGDKT